MGRMRRAGWGWFWVVILSAVVAVAGGCRAVDGGRVDDHAGEETEMAVLSLPDLEPADLGGKALQVVATTSIIGDVVARVGGEAIALTTLMGPGQDPHSYQPAAQDMVTVSKAHVIFVNGWDLEEALIHDLEGIAEQVPFVPVSAGIEPLVFGAHKEDPEQQASTQEDAHAHGSADPHTWFSIQNVKMWVENVTRVLSDLDPAHATTYQANAGAYRSELEALEAYVVELLSSIPVEKRYLVTNHNSFAYLAHAYGLQVLGTVIPAASTMAEPSASSLVELTALMKEHGVCTVFTEATVSDKMAQMVAGELEGCDQVQVKKLYTGAVGPAGSGADSYVGMMRYNVDQIVEGLR
ncbi:MAG: zinc ABC transporter substrate-binding protein [Anaerolineae bacterium]|nr:zinc ABC transporter substrate-binding protein [Anaerolineae bacterium]